MICYHKMKNKFIIQQQLSHHVWCNAQEQLKSVTNDSLKKTIAKYRMRIIDTQDCNLIGNPNGLTDLSL